MDTASHGTGMTTKVAKEFGTWPVEGQSLAVTNTIRTGFDNLLALINGQIAPGNEFYLAKVKEHLELAGFYAIKGVAMPVTGN